MEEPGKPPLKIDEVLSAETVDLALEQISNREEVLQHLIGMLVDAGKITSKEKFLRAVEEREAQAPTYMENHIAIPHGKSDAVLTPAIAFGRSKEGIPYYTPQGGGLAKLIFLLAVPESVAPEEYLRALAYLARLLVHESFLEALYRASSYADVVRAIKDGEKLIAYH